MSKRPITPAYTFAPASQTLNLSGIANFDVRNLFAVINLRTGGLLYAPLTGYTATVAGTTLTLAVVTAAMNAADPLMIIYDDGTDVAADAKAVQAIADQGTREGGLSSSPPEPFANNGSGKIGALEFVWRYTKAAATSLATILGLLQNTDFSGSLSASGNISGPLGTYATQSIVLAGNAVGAISAVGSVKIDGSLYEIPLKIRAYGSSGVAVDSLTASAAGGLNGAYFVETAGLDGVQFQFAWTSGTLTCRGTASKMAKSLRIHAPQSDPPWVSTIPFGVGLDSFPLAVAKAQSNGVPIAVPQGARTMLVELPPGGAIKYAMKASASPAAPATLSSAPLGQILRPNPYQSVVDFEVPLGGGRVMYVTDWTAGTDGSPPILSFL